MISHLLKAESVPIVLVFMICSILSFSCAKVDQTSKEDLKIADYYLNLGTNFGKLGKYQEAVDALKKTIRIKPDHADAHYKLSFVYAKLGNNQEEVDALKKTIRIKPDHADAHYNLGSAYAELGKYQEAVDSIRQAIRIKPDFADAHYNLGLVYMILKDKSSALDEYKVLKDLDDEGAKKLFNEIMR